MIINQLHRNNPNEFNSQTLVGLEFESNAQTDAQPHRGNYWVGTFPPQSGARYGGSNLGNSPFFVNTSLPTPLQGATYLPSNNSPGWFTNENKNLNDCPPFFYLGDPPNIEMFDENIANGEYESQVQNEMDVWLVKRSLYQKLAENPSLISSSTLMSDFWQIHQQGNIGKFYEVEQIIRDILVPSKVLADSLLAAIAELHQTRLELLTVLQGLDSNPNSPILLSEKSTLLNQINVLRNNSLGWQLQMDSLGESKISTAQLLNGNILTTKVFELNEQVVNTVLLEHFACGDSIMTPSRQAIIRPIANQCPRDGGPAVGKALALLPACEQIPLHQHHDDCNELRSIRLANTDLLSCTVAPNPAKGAVEFSLPKLGPQETFLIRIFDVSGREVNSASFSEKSYRMDIKNYSPGIYFYQITPSISPIIIGRFVVSP